MTTRLLTGSCAAILPSLDAESVQCVVTSPPYWGLRDYGTSDLIWGGESDCDHEFGRAGKRHKGGPHGPGVLLDGGRSVVAAQAATKDVPTGAFCARCHAWRGSLGLEPTPELYVEHLVGIFRDVRRVLRDDGTLWLVIGDSYTGSGKGGNPDAGKQATNKGSQTIGTLYGKPVGDTARRAALTNVTRSSTDHGLAPKNLVGIPWMAAFALRADGWILRSDVIWNKPNPMPESVTDRPTRAHEYVFLLAKRGRYYYDAAAISEPAVSAGEARWDPGTNGLGGDDRRTGKSTRRFKQDGHGRRHEGFNERYFDGTPAPLTRNRRSVWTVSTKPYTGAHFATFPPDLIAPCILAGSRPGDLVLDPFGGAGTTGLVADRLGRDALLIELNPSYAAMARERIAGDAPLLSQVSSS